MQPFHRSFSILPHLLCLFSGHARRLLTMFVHKSHYSCIIILFQLLDIMQSYNTPEILLCGHLCLDSMANIHVNLIIVILCLISREITFGIFGPSVCVVIYFLISWCWLTLEKESLASGNINSWITKIFTS